MTDSAQRDRSCGGPKSWRRHDWYTLEFCICRASRAGTPIGFGASEALALRAKADSPPRVVDYGWSGSPAYSSVFASVDVARAWVAVLRLTDVEVRQVWYPLSLDKLLVVWPESAVEPGRARVAALMQAEADERDRRAALPVRADGDPDAWYGDNSD